MSKKVSIIEGQTSKHFGKTSKLQTKLRADGYCFWVPKDESKLVTKRITKNGTYYAKNEKDTNKVPYYGFSKITVAVSNKIHGKKKENPPPPPAHNGDWMYPQNGDDKDYEYSTDDNGNIIENKIVNTIARIEVSTLPLKMSYFDGDTIYYTGLEVTAYTSEGIVYTDSTHPDGIFTVEELTLTEKIAKGSGSQGLPYFRQPPDGVYFGTPHVTPIAYDNESTNTVDFYLVKYNNNVYKASKPSSRYGISFAPVGGGFGFAERKFNIDTDVNDQPELQEALLSYAYPLSINPEGKSPDEIHLPSEMQIPVILTYDGVTVETSYNINVM